MALLQKIQEEKTKGGNMKTSNKNRKKQLLALCLSVLMTSSVTALAACSSNSSTSSSSSSSAPTAQEKDDTLIKNSNFENFAFHAGNSGTLNLIGTSVSSWSKSRGSSSTGSAPTSKAESGIISTKEEDWAQLTTSKEDVTSLSVDEVAKKWDSLTAKDKILYMEDWEDEHPDDKIEEELSFYQSYSIDSGDLPDCKNPFTHDDAEDSNVLMIHNDYPTLNEYNYVGTAQYYTSSSTVTLKPGTAAKLTLWVKTLDLKMASRDKEGTPAIDKGAYIQLTNTVGSKTMPVFQVKNINTQAEGVETNNGWKQYSFYFNSSSYADTSFTLTLGLGQGGSEDKLDHVNGYAFFDDIQCEVISRSAYDEYVATATEYDFGATEEDKTVSASKSDKTAFAFNLYGDFAPIKENEADEAPFLVDDKFSFTATTEKGKRNAIYTVATGKYANKDAIVYPQPGINTDKDIVDVMTVSEIAASQDKYLKQINADFFDGNKFVTADDSVLMMMSASGASFTADSKHTFKLGADEYKAISFFVKTSDLKGFTGASITLKDANNKTALSSIDTTAITLVDINDDEKDIYGGWQQCLFYVKNETDTEKEFTLSFNYGPTSVLDKTLGDYYAGFAAFTKFEERVMDESEFEVATSGTYASVVSLKGKTVDESEGIGFDAVAPVASSQTHNIENGFANPKNYKGVYSDSAYVTNGDDRTVNKNVNAGLLNKDYAENYAELLEKLGGNEATWESVFKDATQPLVIYNEGEQEKAYGFIAGSTTIAANSYATISLRVKTSDGASAYVYLMDTNDDKHQDKLSIGRQITYWYDDEGNVCSEDPSDKHNFNSKKHVAFKLQSNGLYKLDPKWEGYANVAEELKDAYFANLANYEVEKETNDLLVAKGGVSYNYTDNLNVYGNDGKAFYAYDKDSKTAYADTAKKVKVYDFAKADLAPRFDAVEDKEMMFEVFATGDDWATVTFYIHTGDTAKNYRLEVWNGSRYIDDKTVSPAGTYVAFDSNDPADVDATSFEKLVTERKADVEEDEYFEGVFSFYDSAKYLRYDEPADTNGVTNSYDDYLSSAYTASIAYLRYDESNVYEIFADYALSEVTVAADVVEDDSEEDDDHDDHDHGEEINPWLLASSIVIAVVLLLAMASIIVQKAVRSYRKKNGILPKVKTNKKNSDK